MEAILEHTGNGEQRKYHVKWEGWNETTWEPATSFDEKNGVLVAYLGSVVL